MGSKKTSIVDSIGWLDLGKQAIDEMLEGADGVEYFETTK